ncbi:hypothetical protein HDU93_005124 [Gonapodya sp. JEL0774]|nr:hypothetical protein HDU93_005124 [Gonapodya sp. JEL0774]
MTFSQIAKSTMVDQYRSYQRSVTCLNCGKSGHIQRICTAPITSYGIIAVRKLDADWSTDRAQYLLVQRKDTMSYVDIIRGKYPDNPHVKEHLLRVFASEVTTSEKRKLLDCTFDELWYELWLNKSSRGFFAEYPRAKRKFDSLDLAGIFSDALVTPYEEPEYGFPKGRRAMHETELQCAIREFHEETGYKRSTYTIFEHLPPVVEEFVATNGVAYRHVYFFACVNEPREPNGARLAPSVGEIGGVQWVERDVARSLFRPYDIQKRLLLDRVHDEIITSLWPTLVVANADSADAALPPLLP